MSGVAPAPTTVPPPHPTLRFMLSSPWHCVALGGGAGLAKLAPGTWGTLLAWPMFIVLDRWLDTAGWLVLLAATTVVGALAAERTGRRLGRADSGHIVIDEIVAFWCVLFLLPAGRAADWLWAASAFAVFRFFDIVKPPPIRRLDARYKNGFGVMLDDLVAAFYTVLVIALWVRLW